MSDLYEADILEWSERQAALLRRRAAGELVNDQDLDWANIAEEIEDVGSRQRDQIESRLAVLLAHLLKWQFQPEQRSGSWRGTVVEARNRIARLVRKNPSLRSYPADVLAEVYPDGRSLAEAETGLSGLPEACPWTIDQILDPAFWPEDLAETH